MLHFEGYKLYQDILRLSMDEQPGPLGSPRGLKGLLHMLNAIISPTKEDLCFML